MDKKRIKLDICGVDITLITDEQDEYMMSLGREAEQLVRSVSSGLPTSPKTLMTAILSSLDESKKKDKVIAELENSLEDERKKAENSHDEISEEEKEELRKAINEAKNLKKENAELKKLVDEQKKQLSENHGERHRSAPVNQVGELRNPMRPVIDTTGLTSFYEKN